MLLILSPGINQGSPPWPQHPLDLFNHSLSSLIGWEVVYHSNWHASVGDPVTVGQFEGVASNGLIPPLAANRQQTHAVVTPDLKGTTVISITFKPGFFWRFSVTISNSNSDWRNLEFFFEKKASLYTSNLIKRESRCHSGGWILQLYSWMAKVDLLLQ